MDIFFYIMLGFAGFVIVIICYLLGYFKGKNKTNIKNIGNLRIDRSFEDESPSIFLELTTNPEVLNSSEYVKLKVVKENYLKDKTH